jgi:hypothetical protein
MANITTILGTDIKRDTVAVLNANFQSLNAAISLANRYATTLTGVSGAVNVNHNLGTRDVVVQIWDQTGVQVLAQVTVVDANNVRLNLNQSFTGRVVVL